MANRSHSSVSARLSFAGVAFASVLAWQAPALADALAPSPFHIPFEKYVLPNGLEVILHEDRRLPMVAVNVWYHVGATHEPDGRTGFAHLFEHLMFEGSKHAGRRFDPLLESIGGTNMNGTTSWDRTNYFETVPAEHLELALWLEADRMGFMIDALDQERLDVQRDVVKNERRESYENAPYGPSWLRLYEELFPPGHPYRGAVIGSMEDLSRASFDDVRDFFTRYYAPGNATLCLAGHFDPALARAAIAKHFGTLRARGGRAERERPVPVPSPAGARALVKEPVELAQVVWAWLTPPAYDAQQAAVQTTLRILTSGKASRSYQALVQSGLANWVNGGVDDNQLATMVTIDVGVASSHTPERVEAELERVLVELAQHGPTPAELSRARLGLERELRSDLQLLNSGGGEGGRSGLLQRLNHYLGYPGALPNWVEAQRRVTAEDVRRVAANQLRPERRTTVITIPEEPTSATP